MAVCEIWDVRGRLDHPIDYAENPEKTANPKYTEADLQALGDVMKYATNGDKTEKQFFVTGVNCDTATARDEMLIAKAQWNDESEIVCYHGFQSFKSGELTPEQAHEVGVKLAEKMWGDRFQVIVATHLNTDCLHNHFVVNSVSFADGKHYHDNKANLRLLRQRSDELCREYALTDIWRRWDTDAALTLTANIGRLSAEVGNAPRGYTSSERITPTRELWSVFVKTPMP